MKTNLLIFILIFTLFSNLFIKAYDIMVFDRWIYYYLEIENFEPKTVESINVMEIIDQKQVQRIILNGIDMSRLKSLLYIGDSIEINNIRLTLFSSKTYKIENLKNNASFIFTIGNYNNIILQTVLKFKIKNVINSNEKNLTERLNYIANAVYIKYLFELINGKLEIKKDLPLILTNEDIFQIKVNIQDDKNINSIYNYYIKKDDIYYLRQDLTPEEEIKLRSILEKSNFTKFSTLNKEERINAFNNFINQLKNYGNIEEYFKKIYEYVRINFKIIENYSITSDWVNPYDLLYKKKADYKSVAFFYYWTFTQLDQEVYAYFVTPLKKKQVKENKKYKASELTNILLSKNIDPSSNLDLNTYELPDFEKSVLIVTIKIGKYWIYTTGKDWVFTDITNKERVCQHYFKTGVYYTELKDTFLIMENIPINPDTYIWKVFFDVK